MRKIILYFILGIIVLISLNNLFLTKPKKNIDPFSSSKFKVALKELKKNGTPESGNVGYFDVSPDGNEIIFTVNYDSRHDFDLKSDIWKMNIDGTGLKRLTHYADSSISKRTSRIHDMGDKVYLRAPFTILTVEYPKFSGKGNFITYTLDYCYYDAMGVGGMEKFMLMDKNGLNQKEIERDRVYSPDESKYAFFKEAEHETDKGKIIIFDAKTGKSIKEFIEIYNVFSAAVKIYWSPDSKKIAFTGAKEPAVKISRVPVYLWVADVDGDNLREVTWVAVWGFTGFNTIAWSPDAGKIMIGTGGREVLPGANMDPYKANGIWVIDLERNREYKISSNLRAGHGKWGLDGRTIFFTGGGSLDNLDEIVKRGFYFVSFDGSKLTPITDQGCLNYSVVWDDKFILYSSYAQPEISLWLLSIDGKTNKKIVNKISDYNDYQWVESQKGIVYKDKGDIWFMDIQTLQAKKLTHFIKYL